MKEISSSVYREVGKLGEKKRKAVRDNAITEGSSQKAYEIEIHSFPQRVKGVENSEGVVPVIRKALFKEDGKVKRAVLKLDNLGIEVRLVRDKLNVHFSLPNGKENVLGFFDYLKIAHILGSMGLRVESFSVNGVELNRPKLRTRDKDNINVDEPIQKDRSYTDSGFSFSIVL